ncbi:MAG: cytochrome c biogenesis protein ResB [Planctomycetota bacterium]|nr:cytochrome c biogenesis protein ResB [Planctomycetota bacterium]
MKPEAPRRRLALQRAVRFFGGIRFAVPVLVCVAVAMVLGTWIESTRSASVAGRLVYGSWWFITLMALVCLSLVLSVVTRYPWRRRHIGFITVHASLILLIASAFMSYFTRIEGRIVLAEGEQANVLQLDDMQVEVFGHEDGRFVLESVHPVDQAGSFTAAGTKLRVRERWDNTTKELRVTDDGLNPLHAVELRPDNGEPVWIGQSDPAAPPHNLDGVFVHVLPQGVRWVSTPVQSSLVLRTIEGEAVELPEPGTRLGQSGWTVALVEHYQRATVGGNGLAEREAGPPNPAALVQLVHDDGSREQLISFEHFADNVHKKTLAGESHSPYALGFEGSPRFTPLIVFEHVDGIPAATIVGPARDTERFERPAADTWRIESGIVGSFAVLNVFTHTRGTNELVEAPKAENSQPAIVVEYDTGHGPHSVVLPWGQRVSLQLGSELRMLRYGPKLHDLPFGVALADFRKLDYPGTSNAMAYESDVLFSLPDTEPTTVTISMNNPLQHDGWKVYQSGFVGDSVSVFQVTKDPGLVPIYIACTTLCLGIVITFYSRRWSHGHPGIPALFLASTGAKTPRRTRPSTRASTLPTRLRACDPNTLRHATLAPGHRAGQPRPAVRSEAKTSRSPV